MPAKGGTVLKDRLESPLETASLLLGGESPTGGLTDLLDNVGGHSVLLWVVP